MKIRLTKDLTKYGETLVEGAVGTARLNKIEVNDWGQEMVEVKIKGSEALPIGWNALEILDKKFWKDREIAIKKANNFEVISGPQGRFKGIKIQWIDGKGKERIVWCNSKLEAHKCMKIAERLGKKVITKYK